MTVDMVKYWLDESLLGEPIRWGSRGRPHLLSFQQLLQVRTIQYLRDRLEFPLQQVRPVIEELSGVLFPRLFDKEWHELRFSRTPTGEIGVSDGATTYEVKTGQMVIPEAVFTEFNEIVREAREDWVRGEVDIEGYPKLVSKAGVVAGSPTIKGTRVETSFIAFLVSKLGIEKILEMYPHLDKEAVKQAAEFEGVPVAA